MFNVNLHLRSIASAKRYAAVQAEQSSSLFVILPHYRLNITYTRLRTLALLTYSNSCFMDLKNLHRLPHANEFICGRDQLCVRLSKALNYLKLAYAYFKDKVTDVVS